MWKYLFLVVGLCLGFAMSEYDIDFEEWTLNNSNKHLHKHEFIARISLDNVPNEYIYQALNFDYDFAGQEFNYIDETGSSNCIGEGLDLICYVTLYNQDHSLSEDFVFPIKSVYAVNAIILPIRQGKYLQLY
jgi:hypothetical protein